MPILEDWDLALDPDQVLRGQGADPQLIGERSPKLAELAKRVISEASPVLKPRLVYRRIPLQRVVHERLLLLGEGELHSKLLVQHLALAQDIVLIACTIGAEIDAWISEAFKTDPLFGLSLDGLGNAAVESLANQACNYFETLAREEQMEVSIPLSPGMQDWPVDDGQDEIFRILPTERIGVKLNPSRMMSPSKSLSMVIGIGERLSTGGKQCDFCSLKETCRYQDHYV